jgi:hypothetical protein
MINRSHALPLSRQAEELGISRAVSIISRSRSRRLI